MQKRVKKAESWQRTKRRKRENKNVSKRKEERKKGRKTKSKSPRSAIPNQRLTIGGGKKRHWKFYVIELRFY
jgi:hypothetical protein